MPEGALFIGWGEPVRGKEQKALEIFDESMQYYGRLQQEGQITSFEPVLLEPHGGDLAGFVLLRGDEEKLMKVHASDEFNRLQNRVRLVVDNLGVIQAVIGERMAREMAQYREDAAVLVGR